MSFFKKKPQVATAADLQRIHEKLDADMQGLTPIWAVKNMGIDVLLPLLNITDNEVLGKTKAIAYAYRFGYIAGKDGKRNG